MYAFRLLVDVRELPNYICLHDKGDLLFLPLAPTAEEVATWHATEDGGKVPVTSYLRLYLL